MSTRQNRVSNPERTVPVSVRRAVIERDGMVCQLCARPVAHRAKGEAHRPDHMHIDHIIEWATGGGNTEDNLRVCCAACNLGRPKPRVGVVRNATVGFERRNGTYYWTRDDYMPPREPRRGRGRDRWRSVPWMADYLGSEPGRILALIVGGHLAATGGRQAISIEIPADLVTNAVAHEARHQESEARRLEREAVEARSREERATARAERIKDREAERRKELFDSLDPDRVEYWRQVIAAGRAKRKASK